MHSHNVIQNEMCNAKEKKKQQTVYALKKAEKHLGCIPLLNFLKIISAILYIILLLIQHQNYSQVWLRTV